MFAMIDSGDGGAHAESMSVFNVLLYVFPHDKIIIKHLLYTNISYNRLL